MRFSHFESSARFARRNCALGAVSGLLFGAEMTQKIKNGYSSQRSELTEAVKGGQVHSV